MINDFRKEERNNQKYFKIKNKNYLEIEENDLEHYSLFIDDFTFKDTEEKFKDSTFLKNRQKSIHYFLLFFYKKIVKIKKKRSF